MGDHDWKQQRGRGRPVQPPEKLMSLVACIALLLCGNSWFVGSKNGVSGFTMCTGGVPPRLTSAS
jgi:hypothetical protein